MKTNSSDYRLIAIKTEDGIQFELHRVYYFKNGSVSHYLEEPVTVCGSVDAIKTILALMNKGLEKPVLWGGNLFPQEYRDGFEPQDGDFVKLVSGGCEYEIIFKCIGEKGRIWHYALACIDGYTSLIPYTDWSAGDADMFPSDGSLILGALKEAGKRWNPDKKCIEDVDAPKIGDKCIFWDEDSSSIMFGILEDYDEEHYFTWSKKPAPYKVRGLFFHNCVRFSDKSLIEIANRLQ